MGDSRSQAAPNRPHPIEIPVDGGLVFDALAAEHVEGRYRFEVLEGVSHWIAEEAPGELSQLLLEHLASADDVDQ